MSVLVARDLAAAPSGAREIAVRDVSLEVAGGEWVAITGANGCGKSTLALALAGLVPLSAGVVTLDGGPVARARSGGAIALVMQEPSSQLLQSTVREELVFTARNLGRPEPEIAAGLERFVAAFDLAEDLGREPHALSAGRQQLVLLAAALISRPRVLIADEAGAHLDPAARGRALDVLARESAAGLSIVWITQEEDERSCASRTVTLGAGAGAEESGTPAQLALEASLEWLEDDAASIVIEVAPPAPATGPRVELSEAIRIGIGVRGITALVGRNAVGKSVLLEAACGLLESPQIRVTRPLGTGRPPILASQFPELQIFEERVDDELCFGAVSRGLPREQARACALEHLAMLGFDSSFLSRRCWSLSSGERRLTQVVAALIAPASLVVLDEPTAGLDGARKRILAMLTRRRAAADPVLIATQDTTWLSGLGARVVALSRPCAGTPSRSKKTD
jgi:energy-coupling factor transporter ATP-binding protein EcfA2